MIIETIFDASKDLDVLKSSLEQDQPDRTTFPEPFPDSKTCINPFSTDSCKQILFVRGAKVLRLDVAFSGLGNDEENREAVEAVSRILNVAREQGFCQVILKTSSAVLTAIAKDYGFTESIGELTRSL
jgi:hypothetical protein